jgi:endonuclease-3
MKNLSIALRRGPKFEVRKKRLAALERALKKLYPNPVCALNYTTPWELLVAVILSAQCTDKKVNEVTARLFKKYKTLDAYVNANPAEFERDIHETGFFRSKTKSILTTAKMVQEQFGGKIPDTMEGLTSLRGVARKTANVVLGNVYGVVEGIAVDTHVRRFTIRFDLTDFPNDTTKIERELMALLPKKDWFTFTYRAIEYGRTIAPARPYDISKDPLVKIYPPAGKRFRA